MLADDDDSLRRVLEFQLHEAGYLIKTAENGTQALDIYLSGGIDCVITDWRMPKMSGAELLRRIAAIDGDTPIIVITAFGDVETAVEGMRGGAFDFITKPFNRDAILLTVEKALKYQAAISENRRLRRLVHEGAQLENIIGSSEKMREVFDRVSRVAKTDVTVLLEGESGTGKELVAKAIHFNGGRKDKPFVAINCAAIPESLIEAELFGYKKGAFTGATSESKGKFEEATGGTIFLDEISSMPVQLQGRLLRVLQEQEINRLGENTTRKIDVRVIAATNESLIELRKENKFRDDLYYRLAVVPIQLPPLRHRLEDIPLLVDHFLNKSAQRHGIRPPSFNREILGLFFNYSWPGNVRELENIVERLVVLSGSDSVLMADVPEEIKRSAASQTGAPWFTLPDHSIDLEVLENEIILKALDRFDGNQTQAARFLGITRSALIYRMQKNERA